jgi:hypothetical protein
LARESEKVSHPNGIRNDKRAFFLQWQFPVRSPVVDGSLGRASAGNGNPALNSKAFRQPVLAKNRCRLLPSVVKYLSLYGRNGPAI